MTKEDKYQIFITVLSIFAMLEALTIAIGVGVINDLVATANGYKSDRNLCRQELDSIKQDYERLSEEK